MWRAVVWFGLVAGCVESSVVVCDDGIVCPEGHTCDTVHGGCASPEQLAKCEGMPDKTACAAAVIGDGYCNAGVCLPSRCGDGVRATEEICDGTDFATIATCDQVGYYTTTSLACSDTCELDESPCVSAGTCGDNMINGPEVCDGTMPPVETCVDFGYGAGKIACAQTCGPELSGCIPFGWQTIQMPEVVYSVHGTSESNIWVSGANKMIRRFDGTSWHDVASCAGGAVLHLFVLNTTDAIAVDQDATSGTLGVLRIASTGCTRTVITGELSPDALWASSLDDAYVSSESGLWHFTGSTVVATGVGAPISSIWGTGPSDVYAIDQCGIL